MAVKKMEDALNIDVREFTVAGIKYGSMFAHKWYIGTDDDLDIEIARENIDKYLKILNDDYRVERIAAIKDVIVEKVPPSVFYEWMKAKGKIGGQHKFPRVLKNKQLEEWEDFISARR
jgi:hypothetical protein